MKFRHGKNLGLVFGLRTWIYGGLWHFSIDFAHYYFTLTIGNFS